MKSFTLFVSAAIVAAASAINEPVASPTAAVDRELDQLQEELGSWGLHRELAEYERQLGVSL